MLDDDVWALEEEEVEEEEEEAEAEAEAELAAPVTVAVAVPPTDDEPGKGRCHFFPKNNSDFNTQPPRLINLQDPSTISTNSFRVCALGHTARRLRKDRTPARLKFSSTCTLKG